MVRAFSDKCNTDYNLILVNEFQAQLCGDVKFDVNFENLMEVPRNSKDRKKSREPKEEEEKRILCNIMKHKRTSEQPENSDYFHCD